MEIWANEECTERPIVGNEYAKVYVQINADIQEQCPNLTYQKAQDNYIEFATCRTTAQQGEQIADVLHGYWINERYAQWDGETLQIPQGVYEYTQYEGETQTWFNDYSYSFGRVIV